MWTANNWKDYEVIDTGSGEKLERWGKYLLVRPDPQVIWESERKHPGWTKPNGHYHRSSRGGGEWEFLTSLRNGASITGISPSGSSPSVSNIPACFRNRLSIGTGFPILSQMRDDR